MPIPMLQYQDHLWQQQPMEIRKVSDAKEDYEKAEQYIRELQEIYDEPPRGSQKSKRRDLKKHQKIQEKLNLSYMRQQ